MGAVRHLHSGSILIAIHGDCFNSEPLRLKDYFLAQLSGAEQHHFACV
jgi:hypothetical protein